MTRVLRAELVKLGRPRLLWALVAVAVVFAVGSAAVGILNAEPLSARLDGPVLDGFARAGGATLAFTMAGSFAGAFLLAVFAGAVGVEFSRGTLRTLLLHQPGRLQFLAGKVLALLLLSIAVVTIAMITGVGASALFAATRDVSTADWFIAAGWRTTAVDYGMTLLAVTGWALLGSALGALLPSLPVALAIGVGWAGPVEQVLGEAWAPAAFWFPGLLLESLLDPDPGGPSATRALITLGAYCLTAAVAALTAIARRDVTG